MFSFPINLDFIHGMTIFILTEEKEKGFFIRSFISVNFNLYIHASAILNLKFFNKRMRSKKWLPRKKAAIFIFFDRCLKREFSILLNTNSKAIRYWAAIIW